MINRKAAIIQAFKNTLVAFGYAELTDEQTEQAIQLALQEQGQTNIIAKFIHGWLEGEFASLKPECKRLFS